MDGALAQWCCESGYRKLNSPIKRDFTHHASRTESLPHRAARASKSQARELLTSAGGGAPRRVVRRGKRMGGSARALALGLAIGSLRSNNVRARLPFLSVEAYVGPVLRRHRHNAHTAQGKKCCFRISRDNNFDENKLNVFFFSYFLVLDSSFLSLPSLPSVGVLVLALLL